MNSYPFLLFLSLLLVHGSLKTGGVEQKGAGIEDVVVTDGLELHKVVGRARNDPTTATTLSDEETDLQTAHREYFNSDTQETSEGNGFVDETSLADSGSRQTENDKNQFTQEDDGESKTSHDERTHRNYHLKERLNIDSERGKNQRLATRDRVGKVGDKKSVESAKRAEFEASIGDKTPSISDSNSSSTPPPYILKVKNTPARAELDDIYFLFIVIGCSVAGIAGLALAGYCWYKLHTTAKAVSEAEYSAYGATKPSAQVTQGDHKLDYSAEIYHYQQTKSQLSAMEKASGGKGGIKGETLEDDENSDEGDEEDYTVYECHGLAPTGDMTVVNPLFSDQEVVGSDQDGNGDRSGASGQGSPVAPRHTNTES